MDDSTTAPDASKSLTDASSPYFLHSSEQPNQFLVDAVLNRDNYPSWRRSITRALNAKNKLGFVLGTIKRPTTDTAAALLWDRCCDMIMSWLLHSIDRSLTGSLLYCATPNDLWVELETRFQQSNRTKIFRLKRELSNLNQEHQSITTYYGKLKELWDELASLQPTTPCTCGAAQTLSEVHDSDKVYQFLMGLNDSYQQLRSQILATDPLPSIGRCYAILHQEEAQRLVQLPTVRPEISALLARSLPSQQAPTHPRRVWPAGTSLCEACGKPGHPRAKCFELIGYPEWWPSKGKRRGHDSLPPAVHQVSAEPAPSTSAPPTVSCAVPGLTAEQYTQLMELLKPTSLASAGESPSPARFPPVSLSNFSPISPNSPTNPSPCNWVLDSGATHHITSSPLDNLYSTTCPTFVSLPTGAHTPISSIGNFSLSPHLTLSNVLSVPDFKFNLLSVSQLTKTLNCVVSFFPTFCTFQDLTTKMLIGVGEERNGLYYFKHSPVTSLQTSGPISFDIWHQRLGHPSLHNVPRFISRPRTFDYCDICTRGKHTRLPFQLISNKSLIPFDRIFCDIWGGYHTASLSGAHYFLTIVDEHSRVTWLNLMRFKSETLPCLRAFFSMVQTQFASKIRHIRTDNGQEFLARATQDFFF